MITLIDYYLALELPYNLPNNMNKELINAACSAPVAASYMMGSGLTAAVAGGGAALVCHTKAEHMKVNT